MLRHLLVLTVGVFVFPASPALAQAEADRDAVRQAALDYVEGIYNVEPTRIERSVHPALVKRGFWRRPEESSYQPMGQMTFEQLVALARTWNKHGKQDTKVKDVIVYDVMDETASVKIVAAWGIDYMQLAKFDGKWKIVNILWQSHPPKPTSSASQ